MTTFCLFVISCNVDSSSDADIYVADCKVDHQQSGQLIERFNLKRKAMGIPMLFHDTILDNICRLLVKNKAYLYNDNAFCEDSVRQLLHDNDIIDYQFKIIVVNDKDTSVLFKTLLMNDIGKIHIGYLNYANKHILIKTENFLTIEKWQFQAHSNVISGFSNETSSEVFTDSVTCFLKTPKTGRYYCQFLDSIPMMEDNLIEVRKYEYQTAKSSDFSSNHVLYDLIIGTKNAKKYFLISDENLKRIAILK